MVRETKTAVRPRALSRNGTQPGPEAMDCAKTGRLVEVSSRRQLRLTAVSIYTDCH